MKTIKSFLRKRFNIPLRAFGILLLIFCACNNYPQDTYHSFEEIKSGVMLVGYVENPPWVIKTKEGLNGIEVELVEDFAKSINAEIKWIHKNEQNLLKELEHRNLHLVISGFSKDSPWASRIAFTKSYLNYKNQKHVIAIPAGENRLLFEIDVFLKEHEEEIARLLNVYTTKKQDLN